MLIEAGWKPALPGSVESFVITKFENAHGSERSCFDATFSSRRHVLVSKPRSRLDAEFSSRSHVLVSTARRSCFNATFLFRRHVLVSMPRSRLDGTTFLFQRQVLVSKPRSRFGANTSAPRTDHVSAQNTGSQV